MIQINNIINWHKEQFDKLYSLLTSDNNNINNFIITGDSSAGKTRFVEDLLNKLSNNKEFIIFKAYGSNYNKIFPFYTIKNMFYNFFNLRENDDLKEKLFNFTKEFNEEIAIQILYIQQLFNNINKVNYIINKNIIYDSFRQFFQIISKNKKVIISIDDIDSLDESSYELIDYLERTLKKNKIFFIFIKTDDILWSQHIVKYEIINLKKFSIDDSKILIENYLNKNVSIELFDFVYNHGMGNPYYFLKIISSLKENNLLYEVNNTYYVDFDNLKKEFPASIIDLLYQKFENLSGLYKQILIYSSFFGTIINIEILEEIFQLNNIEENLNYLENIGFLYKNKNNNNNFYYFSSKIIKERIYNNIPIEIKKDIHKNIANEILKISNKDIINYEELAYHFEKSDNFKEAIYYYFLAGVKYRTLGDFKLASTWFIKSLFLAEELLKIDNEIIYNNNEEINCLNFQIEEQYFSFPLSFKLYIGAIYYFCAQTLLFNDDRSLDFYHKALLYSLKINNIQFVILSLIQLYHRDLYKHNDVSEKYLSDIEKYSTLLNNNFFTIYALIENIHFLIIKKDIDKELKEKLLNKYFLAKKLLDNLEHTNEKENIRPLNIFWRFLYAAYLKSEEKKKDEYITQINQLIQECEKYLLFDYEKMNFYMKTANGPLNGSCQRYKYLLKSIEYSEKIKDSIHTAYNYSSIGYYFMENKEYIKSLEYFEKAKEISLAVDNRFELGMVYKNLGELNIAIGKIDMAIECLNESIKYKKEFPSTFVIDNWANIIYPYCELCFCYILKGNIEYAKEFLLKSKSFLSRVGMFSREIPVFISFLELYINKKINKLKLNSYEINNIISKIKEININSIYITWINTFIK